MTKEIALHCMKSASELKSELCEECPIYGQTGNDHCFEDALQYVIGMLEQGLRKQQQWIPCSERLPKEHVWIGTKRFGSTISDEVYVTFEALNGKRFCEHCRFQNGEISLSKRIEVDAISKGAKPVAWCELPQPWKGDKK